MKNQTLSEEIKKLIRPLLKPTNEVDAYMGTESAYDLFKDQGWNACMRGALSSGVIPKGKKKDSQKPVEYAQAEGWNRALKKIKRLVAKTTKKSLTVKQKPLTPKEITRMGMVFGWW